MPGDTITGAVRGERNGMNQKGRDKSKEGTYRGIVRLGGGERGGGLGGELVELAGGDAHVYPDADRSRGRDAPG